MKNLFSVVAVFCLTPWSFINMVSAEAGRCYYESDLSEQKKDQLYVDEGNPAFLTGDDRIICDCYRHSSVIGNNEKLGIMVGGEEAALPLFGGWENQAIHGAYEVERSVSGAGESIHSTAGRAETMRNLGDADSQRPVLGRGENQFEVTGLGEVRIESVGTGERILPVLGKGENVKVVGGYTQLSCKLVDGCSGFQLLGYEPEMIKVAQGLKSDMVSSSCVIY